MKRLDSIIPQKILADFQKFVDDYAGKEFLQELTLLLCDRFNISYALIGYLSKDPGIITSAAMIANGLEYKEFSYNLKGTPCEDVVGKNSCFFPAGVQAMFPEDKELEMLKVESYYGSPLVCPSGKPLGLIALMDTKKINNGSLINQTLAIITPRTEKELSNLLNRIRD